MTTTEAFTIVRDFVELEHPETLYPNPYEIDLNIGCPLAEKDHRREERVYAHTLSHECGEDMICVARAFEDLDDSFKIGVLLHEFGHIYGGETDADADWWVEEELGIDIHYDPDTTVQYVHPQEVS